MSHAAADKPACAQPVMLVLDVTLQQVCVFVCLLCPCALVAGSARDMVGAGSLSPRGACLPSHT
eukprot:scaffold77164_cov30-Tisochrysis_lutea.AAC.8